MPWCGTFRGTIHCAPSQGAMDEPLPIPVEKVELSHGEGVEGPATPIVNQMGVKLLYHGMIQDAFCAQN